VGGRELRSELCVEFDADEKRVYLDGSAAVEPVCGGEVYGEEEGCGGEE